MESEDLELLHAENAPREIPRNRCLKLSIPAVPWHQGAAVSNSKIWAHTKICQKEGYIYIYIDIYIYIMYRIVIEVTCKSHGVLNFQLKKCESISLERNTPTFAFEVGLVVLACASIALHWSSRSFLRFTVSLSCIYWVIVWIIVYIQHMYIYIIYILFNWKLGKMCKKQWFYKDFPRLVIELHVWRSPSKWCME